MKLSTASTAEGWVPVIKISSRDSGFLDFYEPLAHRLGEGGKVYKPHAVIPPDARMAIPAPTEVLVTMESAAAADAVYDSVRRYLEGHADRTLVLSGPGGELTMRGPAVPDEADLRKKIGGS